MVSNDGKELGNNVYGKHVHCFMHFICIKKVLIGHSAFLCFGANIAN